VFVVRFVGEEDNGSDRAMISKTTLGVAAGVVGVVAYCIYFDRKRRADPDFKRKLRERRKQAAKARETGDQLAMDLPDMRDYEAVQQFFIKEVQLGEELLAAGDIDNGIDHLSNAVAVCGQPQQLLQVLQQTLPPQVFHLLLQRLPIVSQKLAKSMAVGPVSSSDPMGAGIAEAMAEEDVE